MKHRSPAVTLLRQFQISLRIHIICFMYFDLLYQYHGGDRAFIVSTELFYAFAHVERLLTRLYSFTSVDFVDSDARGFHDE